MSHLDHVGKAETLRFGKLLEAVQKNVHASLPCHRRRTKNQNPKVDDKLDDTVGANRHGWLMFSVVVAMGATYRYCALCKISAVSSKQ